MCLVGDTSNFVSSLANISPHANLTKIKALVKKEEVFSQNVNMQFFVKKNSAFKVKENGTTLLPFQLCSK
jgi:hypothetical protein